MKRRKVLLIGLDAAEPKLVFGEFLNNLPTIRQLIRNGIWGELQSCIPPITIPAWAVMMTGKSSGKLGLSGFRHRKKRSYTEVWIANSNAIKEDTIWSIIAQSGKKCCLVSVPPSYPPKTVSGCLISCFLTPDVNREFTYPSHLKREIEQKVGKYVPDVIFRTEDRDKLIGDVYEMTERRFAILKYLIRNKPWDFCAFVEIGLDRMQHAFWRYFDTEHHLYEANSKYKDIIKDYYIYLDQQISEILSYVDDETLTLIVSDHGAKRMKGAICINDWLISEGYLVPKQEVKEPQALEKIEINWKKTRAWGWGGYYSRIFLNVKGREPEGVIEPEDYNKLREEIRDKLVNLPGPNGEKLQTRVFKPDDIYGKANGVHADLMVFFDDLYWRAAGTIGHDSIYLKENDTGPDDAVHSWQGIFILYDPKRKIGKRIEGVRIEDITPTILNFLGESIPENMEGRIIER